MAQVACIGQKKAILPRFLSRDNFVGNAPYLSSHSLSFFLSMEYSPVADPESKQRVPPDRGILEIVRLRTKFIRARAAKRTEKKGGPGAPGPPLGSATVFYTGKPKILTQGNPESWPNTVLGNSEHCSWSSTVASGEPKNPSWPCNEVLHGMGLYSH